MINCFSDCLLTWTYTYSGCNRLKLGMFLIQFDILVPVLSSNFIGILNFFIQFGILVPNNSQVGYFENELIKV